MKYVISFIVDGPDELAAETVGGFFDDAIYRRIEANNDDPVVPAMLHARVGRAQVAAVT